VISWWVLAHGTSHFFHFMFPPLFPWLMADFGRDVQQWGYDDGVLRVSSIGQALAGFVVDRFARCALARRNRAAFGLGLVLRPPELRDAPRGGHGRGPGQQRLQPADSRPNRRVSTPRLGHAFSVHGSPQPGVAAAPCS